MGPQEVENLQCLVDSHYPFLWLFIQMWWKSNLLKLTFVVKIKVKNSPPPFLSFILIFYWNSVDIKIFWVWLLWWIPKFSSSLPPFLFFFFDFLLKCGGNQNPPFLSFYSDFLLKCGGRWKGWAGRLDPAGGIQQLCGNHIIIPIIITIITTIVIIVIIINIIRIIFNITIIIIAIITTLSSQLSSP